MAPPVQQLKRPRETNADHVPEALAGLGVTLAFGVQGGPVIPVFDALARDGRIRVVATAHEQGAVFAADGYARLRKAPGFCLLTSGPGILNGVTALGSAYMDSVPVVVLAGQVPRGLLGTDAFQEADALGATLPVTKHSARVGAPEDLRAALETAFAHASRGRPRPAVVDLPKDAATARPVAQRPAAIPIHPPPVPPPESLDRAAAILARAQRPMVLAGRGVILSGCKDLLADLQARLAAPVATTLLGIGAVDEDHSLSVGMIGMHGTVAANLLQRECDALLVLGARLDDRATGRLDAFAPQAALVHVDLDASELGKNRAPDVAVHADLADALPALLSRLPAAPPGSREAWHARVHELKARAPLPRREGARPSSREAVALLGRMAARDAVVVAGVGQHQMWAALHFGFRTTHAWLTSGGLGAMGYALPAAMGAQLAAPGRQVVVIDGDGSFHMTSNELATAVRERLPLKIFILNNGHMGMVRQWQDLFHDGRLCAVDNGHLPPFADLARVYGAAGATVDRREDMEDAFRQAFAHEEGPFVVDVRVDPAEHVYPMVPPGKGNHEVLTGGGAA